MDEQRFSPPYEDDSIKEWRKKYLRGQNFLRSNGIEFTNHYAASTACSPSRATLYTGQYPSLHGVTQTDIGGNSAFAQRMFWIDPNTVPSFGDYLRTVDYQAVLSGRVNGMHLMLILLCQVLMIHIFPTMVKQVFLFLKEKNYI